jgi:hypothetical protein
MRLKFAYAIAAITVSGFGASDGPTYNKDIAPILYPKNGS